MRDYESLSHTKWNCKYHVVFIPKRRKKVIYGRLRQHLGQIFHELAGYKQVRIVEGHLKPDHVHRCLSIPPKYAVSTVVGYLKGKSAIQIARRFGGPGTELHRGELLGAGILRVHGRPGRGHGDRLHPGSGERGGPT